MHWVYGLDLDLLHTSAEPAKWEWDALTGCDYRMWRHSFCDVYRRDSIPDAMASALVSRVCRMLKMLSCTLVDPR